MIQAFISKENNALIIHFILWYTFYVDIFLGWKLEYYSDYSSYPIFKENFKRKSYSAELRLAQRLLSWSLGSYSLLWTGILSGRLSKLVLSSFFTNRPKHDEIVLKNMVQYSRQQKHHPTHSSRGNVSLVIGETILCVLIG